MLRAPMIAATLGAVLALASASFAQQGAFGTADEAKAILMKAVAAVKADKANGLDMIAKVEGGFRDRDLYPYCFNLSDGYAASLRQSESQSGVRQGLPDAEGPEGL